MMTVLQQKGSMTGDVYITFQQRAEMLTCIVLLPQELWRGEVIPVSWKPRAFIFKNFLNDTECDHIIAKASLSWHMQHICILPLPARHAVYPPHPFLHWPVCQ